MADKFEKVAWWILGIAAALAFGALGFAVWIVYSIVTWITSK